MCIYIVLCLMPIHYLWHVDSIMCNREWQGVLLSAARWYGLYKVSSLQTKIDTSNPHPQPPSLLPSSCFVLQTITFIEFWAGGSTTLSLSKLSEFLLVNDHSLVSLWVRGRGGGGESRRSLMADHFLLNWN